MGEHLHRRHDLFRETMLQQLVACPLRAIFEDVVKECHGGHGVLVKVRFEDSCLCGGVCRDPLGVGDVGLTSLVHLTAMGLGSDLVCDLSIHD
jgi:hypothetical protein